MKSCKALSDTGVFVAIDTKDKLFYYGCFVFKMIDL